MKFLVLWNLEQTLLSDAMVRSIARMPEYGGRMEEQGKVLMRYHVVGAHGGAWIYDVESHEEFERLLAMAPVFNFARYDIRPLADMTGESRMTSTLPHSAPRWASYDELGAHRHLLICERLRQRRRELGLTQKEVVARLRRIGVVTTNKALSSLEHGAGLDVCKLPEIARALDCSLTYLVGLTDDPASWEPDFEHWPGHRSGRQPGLSRVLSAPQSTPERADHLPRILGPLG